MDIDIEGDEVTIVITRNCLYLSDVINGVLTAVYGKSQCFYETDKHWTDEFPPAIKYIKYYRSLDSTIGKESGY